MALEKKGNATIYQRGRERIAMMASAIKTMPARGWHGAKVVPSSRVVRPLGRHFYFDGKRWRRRGCP